MQNTSNTIRVIRDLSFYLYENNNRIYKFHQVEYYGITNQEANKTNFGGINNSYSFVLPPRSIQRVNCEFCIKMSEILNDVNNLRVGYYDEKDKIHTCRIINFKKINEIGFKKNNDFIELVFRK